MGMDMKTPDRRCGTAARGPPSRAIGAVVGNTPGGVAGLHPEPASANQRVWSLWDERGDMKAGQAAAGNRTRRGGVLSYSSAGVSAPSPSDSTRAIWQRISPPGKTSLWRFA